MIKNINEKKPKKIKRKKKMQGVLYLQIVLFKIQESLMFYGLAF